MDVVSNKNQTKLVLNRMMMRSRTSRNFDVDDLGLGWSQTSSRPSSSIGNENRCKSIFSSVFHLVNFKLCIWYLSNSTTKHKQKVPSVSLIPVKVIAVASPERVKIRPRVTDPENVHIRKFGLNKIMIWMICFTN